MSVREPYGTVPLLRDPDRVAVCDGVARPSESRTIPHPAWGRLYGIGSMVLVTMVTGEAVMAPGTELWMLRAGLFIAGFTGIAMWRRRNRAALDLENWCDCAGKTVTVRIVPSRRPEPRPLRS